MKSLKSLEVSWSPLKSLEVKWTLMKSLKSQKVSWSPLRSPEVILRLMKFFEVSVVEVFWSLLKSQEVLKSVISLLALGYTFSKFGKTCGPLFTIRRTNKDSIKTNIKRYKFCKNLYGFV
jgi:hypothetical protein